MVCARWQQNCVALFREAVVQGGGARKLPNNGAGYYAGEKESEVPKVRQIPEASE